MKKLILINGETGIQFIKFCCVGFLNTGIHFLTFIFLYRVIGLEYLFASAIGFTLGLINSFFINRSWTFGARKVNGLSQFARFVVINIIALLVNLGALEVSVSKVRMIPEIGQVFAIGFSTVVNFFGNKWWTFR